MYFYILSFNYLYVNFLSLYQILTLHTALHEKVSLMLSKKRVIPPPNFIGIITNVMIGTCD